MGNKCMCMRGASKAIGLSLLTFSIGVLAGLLCPLYVLAIIELFVLALLGYLCLLKF